MHRQTANDTPAGWIRVELWTDLICPWCGVGEKNFAKALELFAHRDQVEIVHRSYRLMPDKKPRPIETLLADKYELTQQEIEDGLKKLEDAAAAVGLQYALAGSWAGDTLDGLRLVKLAEQCGKGRELFRELYMACMAKNARFFDPGFLRETAIAMGLDRERVEALLESDEYEEEVLAEEQAMKNHGGRSLPFFLINGVHTYAGALEPSVYLGALEKVWRESATGSDATGSTTSARTTALDKPEHPGAEKATNGGAGCGPEGCLI